MDAERKLLILDNGPHGRDGCIFCNRWKEEQEGPAFYTADTLDPVCDACGAERRPDLWAEVKSAREARAALWAHVGNGKERPEPVDAQQAELYLLYNVLPTDRGPCALCGLGLQDELGWQFYRKADGRPVCDECAPAAAPELWAALGMVREAFDFLRAHGHLMGDGSDLAAAYDALVIALGLDVPGWPRPDGAGLIGESWSEEAKRAACNPFAQEAELRWLRPSPQGNGAAALIRDLSKAYSVPEARVAELLEGMPHREWAEAAEAGIEPRDVGEQFAMQQAGEEARRRVRGEVKRREIAEEYAKANPEWVRAQAATLGESAEEAKKYRKFQNWKKRYFPTSSLASRTTR